MSNLQPTPKLLQAAKTVKFWSRPPGASEECYAMRLDGDCMSPHILDDALVAIEPTLPAFNELAIFYFKDGRRPILKQCRTKIDRWMFPVHPESEVVFPIRFRQWNPIINYRVFADELEAIHNVKWCWTDGKWCNLNTLAAHAGLLDLPSQSATMGQALIRSQTNESHSVPH